MSLDTLQRTQLLATARQSIEAGLSAMCWVPMHVQDVVGALAEQRGSFVTVRARGQLRGSSGTVSAEHSLVEDVWRNAWAAAFADPRFSPLEPEEWPEAELHISVLTPLERLPVGDENELLVQLRPSIDGVMLERDDACATFLPDVWESLPNPVDFLSHLKQKAGWPASSWSPHIKVWRFMAESFGESEDMARPETGKNTVGA